MNSLPDGRCFASRVDHMISDRVDTKSVESPGCARVRLAEIGGFYYPINRKGNILDKISDIQQLEKKR